MPDSNYIGRYIKANKDLPIYIVKPEGGGFLRFDTLYSGEVYPISVYALMNVGSITYARFKVSPDAGAPYPGSNYTYIPFTAGAISPPLQQPYNAPVPEPGIMDKAGKWISGLFIIAAIAYVLKGK